MKSRRHRAIEKAIRKQQISQIRLMQAFLAQGWYPSKYEVVSPNEVDVIYVHPVPVEFIQIEVNLNEGMKSDESNRTN